MSNTLKNYLKHYAGLPRECWQGVGLSFVEAVLGGICYFLTIYLVNELSYEISKASLVISFYGLGTIIGGLVGGKLSDKIPPRIVSTAALLFQAISFLLLIKLNNFYFLIIIMFILGVATYSFITSNYVSVLNSCEEQEDKKLKALSILNVVSNLGIGLSAIIIGHLSYFGFKYLFFGSGILLLLTAILIFFKNNSKKTSSKKANKPLKNELKNSIPSENVFRVLFLILTCLFFIGMIVSQMSTTYSIYLQHKFSMLGIKAFSIIFAVNSFLIVFLQAPLTNFFSNFNKILMVGVGAFLMGFGMFFISFSFIFLLAILSCVIYTIGEMLFFSMAQLVCYQCGGENKKGQSLGIYRMIYAGSRVVGPAVGGLIYYNAGPNILWLCCGVIGVFCLFFCALSKNLL